MAVPTEHQGHQKHQEPWYLRSGVPVLFPVHDGLDLSIPQLAFDNLVRDIIRSKDASQPVEAKAARDEEGGDKEDSFTLVSATTLQETRGALAQADPITTAEARSEEPPDAKLGGRIHPFIEGLLSHQRPRPVSEEDVDNKMLTENGDVAYRSTTSPLLDLFTELEDVVSGPRLFELLNAAWKEDPLATLKVIFNGRSIHLGKASRITFYRCAGWLAQYHPLTLIANLRWLSRPVIQKKAEKKAETDAEIVVVDAEPEKDTDNVGQFDVKHGVSHGYWKDLLNILVLAVNGQLTVLGTQQEILHVERQGKSPEVVAGQEPVDRMVSQEEAKARRHSTRDERHKKAVDTFASDPVYRGLHLTVARLFAEQLRTDLALLNDKDPKAKQGISLCAKWAPSHDRFHDKHTFIVSSIAEMLHPMASDNAGYDGVDRELYLRRAREEYRKGISALRTHLDIVERKLSAKAYDKIKYDRVPSLAMKNYSKIFAEKDTERFDQYLTDVAEGKMQISGATLLPSTLVMSLRQQMDPGRAADRRGKTKGTVAAKMQELSAKTSNGQWNTLVQRIKDSGTLESSIAVCDVSGSMQHPVFSDGTTPMDSAIGLSLLVAEVTAPPFGGHFITFSEFPQVETVDLSQSLTAKISKLSRAEWGMNTNFTAVFESLILPMAVRNKLAPEDMVKRVFVFSDMQFDAAESSHGRFSSSFERIKRSYADAGYEMPELVFWNLAGGRAGYDNAPYGDPTAPKPVTADQPGTAIVSGYSQAMLKVFLDNGSFDDPEEEEEEGEGENIKTTEDGEAVVVDSNSSVKKRKLDPLSTVKKAISHQAYKPLEVKD